MVKLAWHSHPKLANILYTALDPMDAVKSCNTNMGKCCMDVNECINDYHAENTALNSVPRTHSKDSMNCQRPVMIVLTCLPL